MPEIKFWIEDTVGEITIGDEEGQSVVRIKTKEEHRTDDPEIARVPIAFKGSGWGQHAVLWASAKLSNGELARAKCKLRLQRPPGDNKFSDFHYEDLSRHDLGDVAGDILDVNAGYGLHRQLFRLTADEFNQQLEVDRTAQLRAASVLVEAMIHHTARAGGTKGVQIDPDDPIGSFRAYFEDRRMKLEPAVIRALAPDLGSSDQAARK